ncbi:MAG: alpha-L-fucosidase, partial [Planctomycetales bacterium]|nr:alpha-L-fucosidase [Planctomycetales bacterium]
DIADATPYGKDLLAPLADAVRGEGLKFGLYYSQSQDWTHPGGAKARMQEGEGWDPKHRGSYDEYLRQIAAPQTREILTKFKPDVLWWDTPVWMTRERCEPLDDLLSLCPNIITNNRLGGGFEGDTETPEQHIPATGFGDRDWETCMTMNDTWGYKSFDHNWKSTEVLIHNLVDIVSKGGNYLLNVGPTAEGEIPQESIDRLREIGKWMQVNGPAIYATTASPCRKPAWGRLTQKPGRLYLHVFDWPTDGALVVPVECQVTACHLLADKSQELSVESTDEGLVVHTPDAAPDAICSVIELRVEGQPTEVLRRVQPSADGSLVLTAADALPDGGVQVEQIDGQQNLGYWTDSSDFVQWHAIAAKPGKHQATAEVASLDDSRLAITAGGKPTSAKVSATGSYHDFAVQQLGVVDIPKAGEVTVKITPQEDGWQAINLRRLVLTPVE